MSRSGSAVRSAVGPGTARKDTPSPEAARGDHAAAYSLGPTAKGMVGPSLIAGEVVAAGSVGWAAPALLFPVAGLGARSVVRRPVPLCLRRVARQGQRPAEPVGTHPDRAADEGLPRSAGQLLPAPAITRRSPSVSCSAVVADAGSKSHWTMRPLRRVW